MKTLQASDLRIGNIVNLCFEHKEGWFTAKVTEVLSSNTINTDTTDKDGDTKYYYEGVPLTKEWLLKFGFYIKGFPENTYHHPVLKNPEDEHKDLGKCYPDIFFNNRPEINTWMDAHTRVTIKYVHQLQNLYFALTKEELCLQTTKQ